MTKPIRLQPSGRNARLGCDKNFSMIAASESNADREGMMIWILGLLATQALPLEPAGPWEVSTNRVGCQITRLYGPDRNIQIGFEAALASRNRSFSIAGPKKLLPDGIGDIAITFDDEKSIQVHYGSFKVNDKNLRLLKLFPSEAEIPQFSGSSSITVGKLAPPIKVSGIEAALGALDKCATDLLTAWGVDPTLYLSGKMATFTGELSKYFGWRDYPREALAKGISGRVTLLLKTRADGSVEECKAVVSDDASLNAGSCANAVQHLRLKPPLDAAGDAMPSYAVLPLIWIVEPNS